MPIYLDNNATTQPTPAVQEAVQLALQEQWANPSSPHRAGMAVRQQVELARRELAQFLHVSERDVLFTSGGTEANNLALLGLLGIYAQHNRGARQVLITTSLEHASIREPAKTLAEAGVTVVRLSTNSQGEIDPVALRQCLQQHGQNADRLLVSVHWANNETGVIQPVAALLQTIADYRRAGMTHNRPQPSADQVWLHLDATQAVGKIPVHLDEIPADLLTLSAHKFHGPKGVGALISRSGVNLWPLLQGGAQERDRRGGTENVPGILGLGRALCEARTFLASPENIETVRHLRDRLEHAIVKLIPETRIIGAQARSRLWNTTSLAFPRLEAEAVLLALSEKGIFASAGAACSSGSLEPSPVLLAMGIEPAIAHGAIRFSLSRFTTPQEIEDALRIIPPIIRKLYQTMPLG